MRATMCLFFVALCAIAFYTHNFFWFIPVAFAISAYVVQYEIWPSYSRRSAAKQLAEADQLTEFVFSTDGL